MIKVNYKDDKWYFRCPHCGYNNVRRRFLVFNCICLNCRRKIFEPNINIFKDKLLKEMYKYEKWRYNNIFINDIGSTKRMLVFNG